MHTPDLSDEELDALFRQGAERYPEELNLGAWARMEQKLDDAHVQQLVNRKVARLFAAEIGIVAVLLLIWGGYREYAPAAKEAGPNAVVASTVSGAEPQKQQTQAATSAAEPANAPATAAAGSAAAPTAAPELTRPAQSAAHTTQPATATSAEPVAGASRSRRTRYASSAALALAPNDPETGTELESGEAISAAAGQVAGRRRREAKLPSALLAAAATRSRHSGASAGREAATHTTGNLTRSGKATQGSASAPAVGEVTAASRQRPEAHKPATQPTSEQVPQPINGTRQDGPSQSAAELASAAGEATAQPGSGSSAETRAADAAPQSNDTATPMAEALLPRQAQLLTLPGEELPALLPADSVVRRRPRPFLPSRIFITGLYAPELSTVRNAGFEKPGHSVGVQVEYLLTPRLRLNVGLLSSMKHYQARGSDYTWYRPPMYPIERVEGTCRITDVPVNLRFDAWQGVRHRAFVSAGLSSLLMRDEKYYYSLNNYGAPYTRSWQVKKGSKHLFSVVNLSAGVERQLSLRWAVQAEPYVKLPLGGVGAGKVRLSSGGVFFGLKYGL